MAAASLRGADAVSQARGLPRHQPRASSSSSRASSGSCRASGRADLRRRLEVLQGVRLSRSSRSWASPATLFIYTDYVGRRAHRAVVGGARGARPPRASTSRPTRKTHEDLRRKPGRDRGGVRAAHAGRARAAAGALPAATSGRRADDPGLPLRALGRRRRQAGEGVRLHRRLRRAPPGQPLLRAAARGPPEPDLLRDDARGLHQEPERVRRTRGAPK